MRLADRSTSLKTQQVKGPCRANVKPPAEPVVIIVYKVETARIKTDPGIFNFLQKTSFSLEQFSHTYVVYFHKTSNGLYAIL